MTNELIESLIALGRSKGLTEDQIEDRIMEIWKVEQRQIESIKGADK